MQKNIRRTLVIIVMAALLIALGIFEFTAPRARDALLLCFSAALALHLLLNRRTLLRSPARRVTEESNARGDAAAIVKLLLMPAFTVLLVSGLLSSELLPFLRLEAAFLPLLHRIAYLVFALLSLLHLILNRRFLKKAWRSFIRRRPLLPLLALLLSAALIAGAALLGASAGRSAAPAALPGGTLPFLRTAAPEGEVEDSRLPFAPPLP